MSDALLPQELLQRLDAMAIRANRVFAGLAGGYNRAPFAGVGQDLLDHRNFYPGDDLRSVNWNAYLRFERYFLRTFHTEPRLPIRILLDTSGSMAEDHTKRYRALQIAAALSYIGLVRLDAITIQPFSKGLARPFSTGGGRSRFQAVEAMLRALRFGGQTDFDILSRDFCNAYPRRACVVIVSDFFDTNSESVRAIDQLGRFGHDLVLLQLWTDGERMPALRGAVALIDAETGHEQLVSIDKEACSRYTARFDEHAKALRSTALRHGGRYLGSSTGASVEDILLNENALAVAVR